MLRDEFLGIDGSLTGVVSLEPFVFCRFGGNAEEPFSRPTASRPSRSSRTSLTFIEVIQRIEMIVKYSVKYKIYNIINHIEGLSFIFTFSNYFLSILHDFEVKLLAVLLLLI